MESWRARAGGGLLIITQLHAKGSSACAAGFWHGNN